jgi:hypothetical protein
VANRLAQWAQRQGVGVHVHPHMLRHSFASHVLQSSGDLRAVQEMLGHASISATQIYTHLDFQHLAKMYDSRAPKGEEQMKPHHWPWTFVAFSLIGVLLLLVGIAALAGMLKGVHPLFGDDMAGWALDRLRRGRLLTGAFPLVLRRLAEREGA